MGLLYWLWEVFAPSEWGTKPLWCELQFVLGCFVHLHMWLCVTGFSRVDEAYICEKTLLDDHRHRNYIGCLRLFKKAQKIVLFPWGSFLINLIVVQVWNVFGTTLPLVTVEGVFPVALCICSFMNTQASWWFISQKGGDAFWRGWTDPMWEGFCSCLRCSLSSPEQLCLSFPVYRLCQGMLLWAALLVKTHHERVVDCSQKKYHWAIPLLL